MSAQGIHRVDIKNLAVGYSRDERLLEGLELTVEDGEMVALIGRNGSGKSTLLRTILGLIPPLSGASELSGRPVPSYDPRSRARVVSYVSSLISGVPSMKVFDLVSLGRMPHTGWSGKLNRRDREIVLESLRSVQMENYKHRSVEQLSDGERQRVMIARALAQDTPLMALDEPTAFLDLPHRFELIRLLHQFRDAGKSILFSTHDLEMAFSFADKLWVIDAPGVHEGAPEDLGLSGLFHTLFRLEGAHFDEHQARYIFRRESRGSFLLSGKPERVLEWTRHAMKRLGFEEHKEEGTGTEISVDGPQGPWTLIRSGEKLQFTDIYRLARFLTQVK